MKICIINPEKIPKYFPDSDGRWHYHPDFPQLRWGWDSSIHFDQPIDALISEQKGKSDGSLYLGGLKIKLFNTAIQDPYSIKSEIYKSKIPSSYGGSRNYHFPSKRIDNIWLQLSILSAGNTK